MSKLQKKILYRRFIKRGIDLIISILILLISSPIFVLSIFLMMLLNKSMKVFFFQIRPGKNERLFKIIKLKTMNDNIDSDGYLLPDESRTTFIGRYLRKLSIDELPQLFNVIVGDMSLIGPRPLLVEYLKHYTTEQKRRHEVLPGITGWAQIHGRNSIKFEERFKLDIWYVDNVSFSVDFKIFCKTVIKIIKSDNVLSQDPNNITD